MGRCVSSANRSKMLISLIFSSLIISDLDQWLTSDTTEDQIVEWIEQVCDLLSALVPEAICKSLIESQIPAIIDGLVNDNLNPQELCSSIGACSEATPTTPAPTD